MVTNIEKFYRTSDISVCSKLWHVLTEMSDARGVTSSFNFRMVYSAIFNFQPFFIYDNLSNPNIIVPLCSNGFEYDWFGTHELDFPPLLINQVSSDDFLSLLQDLNINQTLPNVGQDLLLDLQKQSLVETFSKVGTRVLVSLPSNIVGHSHWSQRNIVRSTNAVNNLMGEWKVYTDPTIDQIHSVLNDSVSMFTERNRISKFSLDSKRKKYVDLFMSDIHGVISVVGTYVIKGEVAIQFLSHIYKKSATVSVIALNTKHEASKCILQHGFKYSIATLPNLLHDYFGITEVDYQGGNHSWKQEVSSHCQSPQFNVKLRNDNL